MRRNDAKFKPGKRQTSTQPPPVSTEAKTASTSEQAAKPKPVERQRSTQTSPGSTEAKSANTSEQAAKSKPDERQTRKQPPPASTEAKSANTSEQAAKSKPDKRQTSTQPPPASTGGKSANTSEQAAKSKPDKRQTSTQPPPAPTEAKSANTSEQSPTEVFFEIMQSLRRQELSEKEYAQVLNMLFFTRIYNLYGRIDEAFMKQPFDLAWLPDAKPNQQRLNAYVNNCAQAAKLLGLAIELSKAISSMPNTKPTGTGAEDDG
jgi:hypothetical protein